jgi:hypothetical protein
MKVPATSKKIKKPCSPAAFKDQRTPGLPKPGYFHIAYALSR